MLDVIVNFGGLLLRWTMYAIIALVVIIFVMHSIACHMGVECFFDEYIDMLVKWIRDAFRR